MPVYVSFLQVDGDRRYYTAKADRPWEAQRAAQSNNVRAITKNHAVTFEMTRWQREARKMVQEEKPMSFYATRQDTVAVADTSLQTDPSDYVAAERERKESSASTAGGKSGRIMIRA